MHCNCCVVLVAMFVSRSSSAGAMAWNGHYSTLKHCFGVVSTSSRMHACHMALCVCRAFFLLERVLPATASRGARCCWCTIWPAVTVSCGVCLMLSVLCVHSCCVLQSDSDLAYSVVFA